MRFPVFPKRKFGFFVASATKIWYYEQHGKTNDRRRRTNMAREIKYYIVSAEALPEIFIKVA